MKIRHTVSQNTVKLSAQRPVQVQARGPVEGNLAAHDHEFYELSFIRAGSALHETDEGCRELRRGDLLILAPGQIHAFQERSDFSFYNLYYLPEWLLRDTSLLHEAPRLFMLFAGQHLFPGRTGRAPLLVHLDESCTDLTERELGEMEHCALTGGAYRIYMQAALMKCLALWAEAAAGQAEPETRFLHQPLVRRALDGFEADLAEGRPGNVARWAAAAGCSADHFTRTFRDFVGETPLEYFQRRRLHRAAHALIHSTETVAEIAARLGFADHAHLTRSFRKSYGTAPRDYRARFRSAPNA